MEKIKQLELDLVKELKSILDSDANFCRPLSDFWKGCSQEECHIVGTFGIWFSGEGGSCIDGYFAADYYQDYIHNKIEDFMQKHKLHLGWYDCGTPMMLFEGEYF